MSICKNCVYFNTLSNNDGVIELCSAGSMIHQESCKEKIEGEANINDSYLNREVLKLEFKDIKCLGIRNKTIAFDGVWVCLSIEIEACLECECEQQVYMFKPYEPPTGGISASGYWGHLPVVFKDYDQVIRDVTAILLAN